MGLVKFYRGTAGVSLPAHEEGTIFIVERTDADGVSQNQGDMYVDIENAKRLHIVPDSPTVTVNKAWYNSHKTTLQPPAGKVYYIWDWESKTVSEEKDGETVTRTFYTPGIKVGDGNAYLADLPIFYAVTQERKDFWDNKVNAYIETDLDVSGSAENLILTRIY